MIRRALAERILAVKPYNDSDYTHFVQCNLTLDELLFLLKRITVFVGPFEAVAAGGDPPIPHFLLYLQLSVRMAQLAPKRERRLTTQAIVNVLAEYRVLYLVDVNRHELRFLVNWTNLNVSVGISQLPNAGQGLFAKRAFVYGDLICVYGGVRMTHNVRDFLDPQEDPNEYMLETLNGYWVDGERFWLLDEPGRFANGVPWDHNYHNAPYYNNAHYENHGSDVVLVATAPIARGDEILVDYGANYSWERFYTEEQLEVMMGKARMRERRRRGGEC